MDFPSGGIYLIVMALWDLVTLVGKGNPNDGIIELNYAHKKPNNMGRLWRDPYNWITGFHHPISIVNEKNENHQPVAG